MRENVQFYPRYLFQLGCLASKLYEACLTKLKADSTSKDYAIKALQDNLSEEASRNEASLKKEHDATGDLKMKQKKEIETKDEAIRVMQHKIAEEKTNVDLKQEQKIFWKCIFAETEP